MAFAPSKARRYKKNKDAKMNLSSMMDMMTIILLFLLKSYSASGALIKPAVDIQLPTSSVQTEPKRALAVILIKDSEFLQPGLYLDTEEIADAANEKLPASRRAEIVQQFLLAPIDQFTNDNIPMISGLLDKIEQQQRQDEELGKKITDEMTIQAAENIPYSWILKITATGSLAQMAKYDFVVVKEE